MKYFSILKINPFFQKRLCSTRFHSTRHTYQSSFGFNRKFPVAPRNWKLCFFMFSVGAYFNYDETIFDYYFKFTDTFREDSLLSTRLNYELTHLPLYEQLAHPRNESRWIKLDAWDSYNPNGVRAEEMWEDFTSEGDLELLSHVLAKPGGISIKPVSFFNPERKELVTFIHLGYRLCGYPFLVHGGILATILSEAFKLTSSMRSGVHHSSRNINIKHLSIKYKAPSIANNFLTIRTKIKDDPSVDKCVLEGSVESQEGKLHILSVAVTESLSGKGWFSWFLNA